MFSTPFFGEFFPYTNLHDLNLDYILKNLKALETSLSEYADVNSIKYADPFEWDITTAYGVNTLVSDGTVIYLAKKPVPAGIALSDSEYWKPVFDASGYNLLQDQINANRLVLGTHTEQIAAVNTRVDETNADVQDVADHLTDLIPAITRPAQMFSETYAVCFGDSNTMPNPPDGYGNTFERICAFIPFKDHKSYGISGAGFQSGLSSGPQISAQIAGANDFAANSVGFVFVMGGINDWNYSDFNATTFGQAVASTLTQIRSKFPNALIVCAFDGGHMWPNENMMLYQTAMERNCVQRKMCAYVSLADLCLHNSLWASNSAAYTAAERSHYSPAGANAIAARVVSGLFGNSLGFTVIPTRTVKHYTASNPAPESGAYNFWTVTDTIIDPITMVRTDHSKIITDIDFYPGEDLSASSILCRVPGRLSQAAGAIQRYLNVFVFTASTGACEMKVTGIVNSQVSASAVYPNSQDYSTCGPMVGIRALNADQWVGNGKRAMIEFTSYITGRETS